MLCSVGPPSPPTSNHPRKSRSSRAYGAFCSSSSCAISCATELLPEPYTPVMSTAPSTPLFTPASYLLLPAVAIGVGEPLGVVWGRSPPSSGILRYSLKCVEEEFHEVRGSKRPTGRGGKRHTAAWWHHFGL